MTSGGISGAMADATTGDVWTKTCQALKRELGEATFGSWLGQAALRERGEELCLVAATGVARDWIRRHAWRRIAELWAQNDPRGRHLDLKSRMEFDTQSNSSVKAPTVVQSQTEPAVIEIDVDLTQSPQVERVGRQQGLQERFSFDTFVSGPANEFAFAVARRVASWADGHFNPVLFHGPYGFGKTHLLNALAWEAMRTAPEKKVVYLSAERFTSTFMKALQDRQTSAFKSQLRDADLLLIDDVQFVAGKSSTQEELFHTLISLVEDGRRVVMTADRSPSELSEMEPRLRSHLQSGLVCGIEPADRVLRLGIIERKLATLAEQGRFVPSAKPEVLQFLADRFTDSVRELEGALIKMIAYSSVTGAPINLAMAQQILKHLTTHPERRVSIEAIVKTVSERFSLTPAQLRMKSNTRQIAYPRQVAMYLVKELTAASLPEIGRAFGGKHHTTVLHSVQKIEQLRHKDSDLNKLLHTLSDALQ